ncbi:recombination protein F [Moraxella lacunata]|uniref:Recombination protein F n=1 Tax=Moraxella lacunata TaxID=477 RepID=A0A378QJJ9_MORLA|nr:AAA family ATPase [Moraxella lacunata]STZ01056.1 recombination protein F [Moraxella lacunata]
MKVKQLQLQNYGRFDDLTMEFAPNGGTKGNVTIIVGNNGAGKSQILQALATGFSWFVGGIKDESNGLDIDENLIKNNSDETQITFDVDFGEYDYRNHAGMLGISRWNIVKIRGGKIGKFSNYHKELKKVIKNYRYAFTNNDNLSFPLIVFYTIKRSGMAQFINQNSPLKDQLKGYDYALDYGVDFNAFFDWLKELEDIENADIVNEIRKQKGDDYLYLLNNFKELNQLFEELNQQIKGEKDEEVLELLRESRADLIEQMTGMEMEISKGLQLKIDSMQSDYVNINAKTIRLAIERFTDFRNIRIERKGTPKMVVEKDGEKLDVNQLSQGEKSLLALVGDIARRLAILNPSLDNPLQGEGVVLIDEVDLHLHPKWQQNLIDKLTKTFPNVQFILTTHSPHIVSDNPDVLVYILDNGELRQYHNAYGEDVNTLLNGVFGVSERTPEIAEKFKMIGDYIGDKQLDNAKNLIDELSQILPKNHTHLLRTQLTWAKAKLDQSKEV